MLSQSQIRIVSDQVFSISGGDLTDHNLIIELPGDSFVCLDIEIKVVDEDRSSVVIHECNYCHGEGECDAVPSIQIKEIINRSR